MRWWAALGPLSLCLGLAVAAGAQSGSAAVEAGATYYVRACFAAPVTGVAFDLSFHEDAAAGGSRLAWQRSDGVADGAGCYRSSPGAYAPCGAAWARFQATASPDVAPESLHLVRESPPDGSCAAPTPTPTPAPAPTPAATATVPRPPPSPPPSGGPPAPSSTPSEGPEPAAFPSLVNGGFEQGRADGSPYGWNKFGGALDRSAAWRREGLYSAALRSATTSTKWAFQTVLVQGGQFYELSGYVLKDDPAVAAAWLRVSWYASADGSGTALAQHDSTRELGDDAPAFRFLTTGPVQAPAEARSARVRLMLRPRSAAEGTVFFDDITFVPTSPPSPSAGTPSPPARSEGGASTGPAAWTSPTPAPAARSRRAPTGAPDGAEGRAPATARGETPAPGPQQDDGVMPAAAGESAGAIALANVREAAPRPEAPPPESAASAQGRAALVGIAAALGLLVSVGLASAAWRRRRAGPHSNS